MSAFQTGLDDFLHPGLAFDHPLEVVHDPDLTIGEKRAILASWASDARAMEAMPHLRQFSHGAAASLDDIRAALRALDPKGGFVPADRRGPPRRPRCCHTIEGVNEQPSPP